MTIGVLALQGDVREHLRAIAECGAESRPVRRIEELEAVDALVIPGGESTTMSNLAIAFGLLEPIRKRIAGGMPVYGSCAGMIMLAGTVLDGRPDQESFGGIEMTVRRNAFGRQVDSFEARCGSRTSAAAISTPCSSARRGSRRSAPDVRVMGRVTSGPAAGRIVAVQQGNLLATAFHPELTGDLRVHRHFVELVRNLPQANR